jgi:hypothetical protein
LIASHGSTGPNPVPPTIKNKNFGQSPEVLSHEFGTVRGQVGARTSFLGRPLAHPDASTYIAKYRWLPAEDIVLILAVRHQLEAGYAGE